MKRYLWDQRTSPLAIKTLNRFPAATLTDAGKFFSLTLWDQYG